VASLGRSQASEPITPIAAGLVAVRCGVHRADHNEMSSITGIKKREFWSFSAKLIAASGVGAQPLDRTE
jgi:hypothetical protein